jgi:hypothetical protein
VSELDRLDPALVRAFFVLLVLSRSGEEIHEVLDLDRVQGRRRTGPT